VKDELHAMPSAIDGWQAAKCLGKVYMLGIISSLHHHVESRNLISILPRLWLKEGSLLQIAIAGAE